MDGDADYTGIARTNTAYDEGFSIDSLGGDTSINMVGILLGDVNDTYSTLIA